MRVVASLIVRNEMDRYLALVTEHLQGVVDEICVLDDYSEDGTLEFLRDQGINVVENTGPTFYEHEGAARQALLAHTLAAEPDWILAIDADEFVGDPYRLRDSIDSSRGGRFGPPAYTLLVEEVWEATPEALAIRHDGGWRPHGAPLLYRVPPIAERRQGWRINPRKLAGGREPMAVRRNYGLARDSGTSLLHFGWAKESERQRRYDRYVEHDGGEFHASSHLASILAPPEKVRTSVREWPEGLHDYAADIARRAS